MSRIEVARLLPEQVALLREYRQRWESIRTSTARADRDAAESGVVAAYTAAGLAPPQRILWCDGPLDVVRSCTDSCLADAGENVKSLVVDSIVREAAYAVDARVSREVRAQIAATFATRIANPISTAVMAAITLDAPSVRVQRFAALRRLWQWVRGTMLPRWMETSFREHSFSQHDAPSLGVFEYMREVCGLDRPTDPVMGLCRVARNVGWIMPHRRICWLVERPTVLSTDDRGRLHGPKGPAIRFADDWCFYAWKGVALPAWMIERPDEITPRRVDRERDPILRRCMIEIMTPERYIREGEAVCISEDDTGLLWSRTWSSWDAWTAVEVINGTPEPDGTHRHYFLQVPPTVRTARQAVAWTYGLTELEYRALKLRT